MLKRIINNKINNKNIIFMGEKEKVKTNSNSIYFEGAIGYPIIRELTIPRSLVIL